MQLRMDTHLDNFCSMFPEIDPTFVEFLFLENQKKQDAIPKTLEVLLRFQRFLDSKKPDSSPPPYSDKKGYINYKWVDGVLIKTQDQTVATNFQKISRQSIPPPLPPRVPGPKLSSSSGKRVRKKEAPARHKQLLPIPFNDRSPKSPRKNTINDRSDWQTFDE